MKINYNKAELDAAAHYISMFYSVLHPSFEKASEFILGLVDKYANDTDDAEFVESGGVHICFDRSRSGIIYLIFLVDPTLVYPDDFDEVEYEL